MWTIAYLSKPAFLAFLEKSLLAPLVLTKVLKWKCVFLLEEVLGAGCSIFMCGRLIRGWTDFGQFVQTKPSNIFLDSSLSFMSMQHLSSMFKAQNLISFTSGHLWFFMPLYLNSLFPSNMHWLFVLWNHVGRCWHKGATNLIHFRSQHHIPLWLLTAIAQDHLSFHCSSHFVLGSL